ncbi:MAG: phosphate/phosphite/phosphonate ABC transporter substrate-binding protein [Myxococcota bacterium]
MPSIHLIAPASPRTAFRFVLPPSLGASEASARAHALERFFTRSLGKQAEVSVAQSYESLARELLSGKSDAAWAPPFVCARMEAMGVRVLVRGVRRGASSYRAALLCRQGQTVTLEGLAGLTAAWTDQDSVGGYLLPMAFLRAKGLDPLKAFFAQRFAGSYLAAAEEVAVGTADVCSVFAPPARAGVPDTTGLQELAPQLVEALVPFAFTEEAPNDGVAVSMNTPQALTSALEKSLLGLAATEEGQKLLRESFNAEGFEVAPRMGYRALYRVALASI